MGTNQRSSITLSDEEVQAYLASARTAVMGTIGPNGFPHLVAMWFAVIDGEIWFETKTKAQKTLNLRRDPKMTVLVEDGWAYDALRGVAIEGTGEIVEDPDRLWEVGVNVWERYNGPYTEDMRPFVEVMLQKRVAVRLVPERVRSWDHKKLGMESMPLGGTTEPHLTDDGRYA